MQRLVDNKLRLSFYQQKSVRLERCKYRSRIESSGTKDEKKKTDEFDEITTKRSK